MDRIFINVGVPKEEFQFLMDGLRAESGQHWDRIRTIHFLEQHMGKIVNNFITKSYGKCDRCGAVFFRKTANQKSCKRCQR